MATEPASTSGLSVRRYRPYRERARREAVVRLLAELRDDALPVDSYAERLEASGGGLWVVWEEATDVAVALAEIEGLPGLPELFELGGGVSQVWRRRGVGRFFWGELRESLPAAGIHHLEVAVPTPGAQTFLEVLGFWEGHRELSLRLPLAAPAGLKAPDAGLTLRTLPAPEAIGTLRALYEGSFAGHPWHQPYEDDAAVAEWLQAAADILFLCFAEEPIGFVWLQPQGDGRTVQLEPVGLLPAWQGRGWGRYLLLAALAEAYRRGFRIAEIGVWAENEVALGLYRSVGFRPVAERLFMRVDLPSSPLGGLLDREGSGSSG